MDLKEQKYVCALAECGNLTRAAEKLYISQPALSLYITNLEKNMGVELFERKGKGFTLTYAGEQYVERAKKMLALEREFNEELADILRGKAGRIRLGVALRRGPWLIPPVLAKYEKEWPGIEVVIREGNISELNEMLGSFELDMIILNRTDIPPKSEVVPLFKEEFLLMVPRVHSLNEKAEYVPGSRYRKIAPEHLNGQEMILYTPWQSTRKISDKIMTKYKIKPGRIRIVRSAELANNMVAEGLGIGFIREGYVGSFRYRKPVNYYMLDIDDHTREVVAAYKKGTHFPDYMQAMVEMLKEQGERFLEP